MSASRERQTPAMPLVRRMTVADVTGVARLHAASWRYAYADILSPAFLRDSVEADRAVAWAERVHELGGTSAFGWVVEEARGLTGFAYVRLGADPVHGHLVDNVHVAPDRHGGGLGRRLLGAIGAELERREAPGGVYLWVYATNERAQGFYARCGAARLEEAELETVEGRRAVAYRYGWPSAQALLR